MKLGPFEIESRISLTGVMALGMAFTGLLGGWYAFSARQAVDELRIEQLEKNEARDAATNDRLNDTLNVLNNSLGKVNQRLDDAHVGEHKGSE